jgi:NADH pyrophosphatase NudC (nudix superfamily)
MNTQVVRVIVVVRCADKFLLVQRHDDESFPPKWQNVYGVLQSGESIEQSVSRIVQEQLAMSAVHVPHFVMSTSLHKESSPTLGVVMFVQMDGKPDEVTAVQSDELQNYGWFTLPQAGAVDLVLPGSASGTYAQLQRAAQMAKEGK